MVRLHHILLTSVILTGIIHTTDILHAAQNGEYTRVKHELAQGTDVDKQARTSMTALHMAARNGDINVMHLLLAHGANVELSNKVGKTPLHLASRYGHINACRLLLDNGASIDAKDNTNKTPLHYAASNNQHFTCQLLLSYGADPRISNQDNETPRQEAENSVMTRESYKYIDAIRIIRLLWIAEAIHNDTLFQESQQHENHNHNTSYTPEMQCRNITYTYCIRTLH